MKTMISLVAICLLATALHAQQSAVFSTNGKAIKGYDPVAFFKESKAMKGSDSLHYQWNNATWLFASKDNMQAFESNPEAYAPQYGGYCAYGTAEGHKAPTETETWTIANGKLYFNYNKKVKEYWMKDQAALIEKADVQWPKIKDEGK